MPGTEELGVFEVVQRVLSAGRPIGVETSALPAALVPRLETQLRFGQHLYPVLADYGLLVVRVEDVVGVEIAGDHAASLLGCDAGIAALSVARRAHGLDGRTVEVRRARYLPDEVKLAA